MVIWVICLVLEEASRGTSASGIDRKKERERNRIAALSLSLQKEEENDFIYVYSIIHLSAVVKVKLDELQNHKKNQSILVRFSKAALTAHSNRNYTTP